MFHRLYMLIGIAAMVAFSIAQYRGTSPFDAFADTASSSGSSRSGSSTYHK